MTDELTKKAAELLLKGATLLGEPCPYCKGVRVLQNGNALCVNCGSAPKPLSQNDEKSIKSADATPNNIIVIETLEKKLASLTDELAKETDHQKQQDILKSINSISDTITKLKSNHT
jgi:UPF0148 protein